MRMSVARVVAARQSSWYETASGAQAKNRIGAVLFFLPFTAGAHALVLRIGIVVEIDG
jgi:hypothetical protein